MSTARHLISLEVMLWIFTVFPSIMRPPIAFNTLSVILHGMVQGRFQP
jgi:hypothetical protein